MPAGANTNNDPHRLTRLLDIARDYRGWSKKELAEALGRDVSRLIPPRGNPKMEYIFKLAEILDWAVADIVVILFDDDDQRIREKLQLQANKPTAPQNTPEDTHIDEMNFKEADHASREALDKGRFRFVIRAARQAVLKADTPEQRSDGHLTESLAWESLGRYPNALTALRKAIRETPISPVRQRNLQSNLSNLHYSLWNLTEARTLSNDLIQFLTENPPDNIFDKATSAYSHYIQGHTLRRLLGSTDAKPDTQLAKTAIQHLNNSIALYDEVTQEHSGSGGSNIGVIQYDCRCGLIELDVLAGNTTAEKAIKHINTKLDDIIDLDDSPISNLKYEGLGWLCVFGCNIALRGLTGSALNLNMAVFTNKGYEIADHIDNWAIRERLFTLEYFHKQQIKEQFSIEHNKTLDSAEVRVISGTMGRFPAFRRIGWSILENSDLLHDR